MFRYVERSARGIAVLGCCVLLLTLAEAFYLPGVAPADYPQGKTVMLKVNKLDSVVKQMPYDYYSLPFADSCKPSKIQDAAENMGEILMGDRIYNSKYNLQMNIPVKCEVLCEATYSAEDHKAFAEFVEKSYRAHWIIDNLPSASIVYDGDGNQFYKYGFPVGFIGTKAADLVEGDAYLNNFVKMTVKIHTDPSWKKHGTDILYRVVGFEVAPYSMAAPNKFCSNPTALHLDTKNGGKIEFLYSVDWQESDIKWASRWDNYLYMQDSQVHWFSIMNSLMIFLFLTIMVAMIMLRTLSHDLKMYNEPGDIEDVPEGETGWKLVHGDVFRTPPQPMFLSVLVGTGVQIFVLALITMVFAVLGFTTPANRGGLMRALLSLYVLTSFFSGYFAARTYKRIVGVVERKYQIRNMLFVALFFPGIVFGVFFLLNLIVWANHSSQAIPFKYLVLILALWMIVSLPLCFLGSWLGFKKVVADFPVRTNQIPRQVPAQVWYMRPLASMLVGGVLPFGAVFIELFFILSSIWLHQFYYMFGFLFVVFVILVISSAEISVVMVYFQLCAEDYRWWWRSLLTSGASAFYFALYSGIYFLTRLRISAVSSSILYFGYTLMMVFAFFLLTGAAGFYAAFLFVFKIYSAVKVD